MTTYTHQTAPTQFVEASGIRFAYQYPERFVRHVSMFLSEHLALDGEVDLPLCEDGLCLAERE